MDDAHVTEPAPVFTPDDLTGALVGRFRITRRLGGGGMGEVYEADDPTLKRSVAIKRLTERLRQNPHYKQELLKEARRASALNHKSVAGVYDAFEERGEVFVVMEYVEGETLRDRMRKPIALGDFLPMATQTVAALSEAHSKGIVHRDIKPENIMLTSDGTVKVLDFGVARHLPQGADRSSITETDAGAYGTFAGTLTYMAPEILLDGRVDARSDIFSLGVVFYETLTGEHPFRSQNHTTTVDKILHTTPPPITRTNTEVTVELDAIVDKMLSKRPEDRYETTLDLGEDIEALRRGEPLVHPQPRPRWWQKVREAATGAIVTAVALIVLYAVITWLLGGGGMRVAVLPIKVMGDNPLERDVARADGLTYDLTSRLSELELFHEKLLVVPASEVYGNEVTTVAQARKLFGVDYVVTGSLQRQGDGQVLRISVVDARDLVQLRSRRMERAGDFLPRLEEVTGVVARMLPLELDEEQEQVLAVQLSQDPEAMAHYLEGQGYKLRYEDPEEVALALRAFRAALDVDDGFALAYAGLGEALLAKYYLVQVPGLIDEARGACHQAVEIDPSSARSHICLGSLFHETGQYELAVAEFKLAQGSRGNFDGAYRGQARAEAKLGKLEQAEETYRRAIAARPDYWAGYDWLGGHYAGDLNRFEDGAAQFKKAKEKAPGNVSVRRHLGTAYIMMGRYRDAQTELGEALAIRPTSRLYENLGLAHFHLREFAQAVEMYEKATEMASLDYIAWGSLARAYHWSPGLRDKAPAAYQRAVALARERLQVNPNDTDVHILLAYYYAMLGERNLSLDSLQQAHQASSRNSEFLFWAAVIYDQFGEREKALEQLGQAIAIPGGHSLAELRTAVELDDLRDDPKVREFIGSP